MLIVPIIWVIWNIVDGEYSVRFFGPISVDDFDETLFPHMQLPPGRVLNMFFVN